MLFFSIFYFRGPPCKPLLVMEALLLKDDDYYYYSVQCFDICLDPQLHIIMQLRIEMGLWIYSKRIPCSPVMLLLLLLNSLQHNMH